MCDHKSIPRALETSPELLWGGSVHPSPVNKIKFQLIFYFRTRNSLASRLPTSPPGDPGGGEGVDETGECGLGVRRGPGDLEVECEPVSRLTFLRAWCADYREMEKREGGCDNVGG